MTGTDADPDLREPLALFGLEDAAVIRLPGGMVNVCFKVTLGSGAFVLKWYRPGLRESESEYLAFVCGTQEVMREAGVPTPAIVASLDGRLFAETHAGFFVVTEFVHGRQFLRGSMPAAYARAMGSMLDRLLRALREVEHGIPRRLVPSRDEAIARNESLTRLIERRPSLDAADTAALAILRDRRRGLEAWRGPVPQGAQSQWIHGDYQDTNLIFGSQDKVIGILDWDNLTMANRGYEVMRSFNYSFPGGAPGGMEFLEGYVRAATPLPEEASGYIDLWSYNDLQRIWPINVRYEQPEVYQDRWDEFIRPPTGWWQENKEAIRTKLIQFARDASI